MSKKVPKVVVPMNEKTLKINRNSRDKPMDKTFIHIPNDDKQDNPTVE